MSAFREVIRIQRVTIYLLESRSKNGSLATLCTQQCAVVHNRYTTQLRRPFANRLIAFPMYFNFAELCFFNFCFLCSKWISTNALLSNLTSIWRIQFILSGTRKYLYNLIDYYYSLPNFYASRGMKCDVNKSRIFPSRVISVSQKN